MSDATSADVSQVNLNPIRGGLNYYFSLGANKYQVFFKPNPAWMIFGIPIARIGYEISFDSRDSGYRLAGNTQNPTSVYAEVIKAIRKLIQEKNPEFLTFMGAGSSQDVIYDKFYRRYLSQLYTRVGVQYYLRNDLYKKYEQENGPEWQAIQKQEQQIGGYLQDKIKRARNLRMRDRQQRVKLKNPNW